MEISPSIEGRRALVRRGLWLDDATIGYNAREAIVSLVAGRLAGSVAPVGRGVGSAIELTAAGAAQWRLRSVVVTPLLARAKRRVGESLGSRAAQRSACSSSRWASILRQRTWRACPRGASPSGCMRSAVCAPGWRA